MLEDNKKRYIWSLGNCYYYIEAPKIDDRWDIIQNNQQKKLASLKLKTAKHYKYMLIKDLVTLYKMHGNNLHVEKTFATGTADKNYLALSLSGNENDFYKLVREVINLENELKNKNIYDNKYELMKYIYDKYKMISDYWNPISNYGNMLPTSITNDRNRIVNHPYDYLGLINDNYATCQGMADSLAQLYRYFGIEAEVIANNKHAMTKVHVIDDQGQEKVSYIDLSREIATEGFSDTRYRYVNHNPINRPSSIRACGPNSYQYFMKRNINRALGEVVDNTPDQYKAVDYIPLTKPKVIIKGVVLGTKESKRTTYINDDSPSRSK